MKESSESHDTIMTAGSTASAFPKADKSPVNQQQGEIHVLRTLEQIQAIRPIWEALQSESGGNIETDFDRYISLVESDQKYEPYILLLYNGGIPCAMLIGTRGPVRIDCQLGYLKVFRTTLCGVKITYGGYLGDFSEQTYNHLLDYLYTSISKGLADVVRFEQLPRCGRLYSGIRKRPSILCRSRFPKIDMHWQMKIPDSMESFYAQRSSKTRQTLKRYSRQVEKKFQTQLIGCTSEDSLSKILSEAASVSSRTYQHALGWGLTDDVATRQKLIAASRNGWLRLHLLRLGEKSCAFQLGFQYRGTYFLQTMGFDPEMKKWRLGTALFLKILEQLCRDSSVDCIDFGYGDAAYKRRFGTKYWYESTVYMFAPRVRPVLVNSIQSAVRGFSIGMRWTARKVGIEGMIKQKWRRLLQKSQKSDSK